jgi:hypothetical protein
MSGRPSLTKTIVYGGIAVAVLGPALVIGAGVSVGAGSGTFTGGLIEDIVPAFVDSLRNYEPGQPGLFEDPTAPVGPAQPAPAPVTP